MQFKTFGGIFNKMHLIGYLSSHIQRVLVG